MPRYGLISERRNRLHEVIRLSGCKIGLGEESESLKVKVASIPGIRLQVYFTDCSRLFKRKGIYESKKLGLFDDNLARAAFFARAVLTTTNNLGWSPDVIHAHGWLASLIPTVARTEFAENELFGNVRCVYSPDGFSSPERLTEEQIKEWEFASDAGLVGVDLPEIACHTADSVVYGAGMDAPCESAVELPESTEAITETMSELYTGLVSSDGVAA